METIELLSAQIVWSPLDLEGERVGRSIAPVIDSFLILKLFWVPAYPATINGS